jgi:hypothetical protein
MTRGFADIPSPTFFLSNARVPAAELEADGLEAAPDSNGLIACDIRVGAHRR